MAIIQCILKWQYTVSAFAYFIIIRYVDTQHRWVYVYAYYTQTYPTHTLRYAINTTTSARAPGQVMSGIAGSRDKVNRGKTARTCVHRAVQCKPLRRLRRDRSCSCCRRCWRYLCRQIVHYTVRVYIVRIHIIVMCTQNGREICCGDLHRFSLPPRRVWI